MARQKGYYGNEYTRNKRRIVGRVVFNVARVVSRNVLFFFLKLCSEMKYIIYLYVNKLCELSIHISGVCLLEI
jgi:hypothetical protein